MRSNSLRLIGSENRCLRVWGKSKIPAHSFRRLLI